MNLHSQLCLWDVFHLCHVNSLWSGLTSGDSLGMLTFIYAHGKATGMIVGARLKGNFISAVLWAFNIPQSTVSHVYRQYVIEGTTTHSGQCNGRPQVLNDCDWWQLSRIVQANRQATLTEITCTFFSFHRIWEQKTHQSVSVNTTTQDTAPHLGLWGC